MKCRRFWLAGFNGFSQIRASSCFRQLAFCVEEVSADDVIATKSRVYVVSGNRVECCGWLGDGDTIRVVDVPSDLESLACTATSIVVVCRRGSDADVETKPAAAAGVGFRRYQVWRNETLLPGDWKEVRVPGEFASGKEIPSLVGGEDAVVIWNSRAVSVLPNPTIDLPSGIEVTSVAVGKEHFLLLTKDGRVFSWGEGRRGALGHGGLDSCDRPTEIECLSGLRVAKICAGFWHNVAVTEAHDVCVWGWNESGQLGLPSRAVAEHRAAGCCPSPAESRSPFCRPPLAFDGAKKNGGSVDPRAEISKEEEEEGEATTVSVVTEPRFLECFPDDLEVLDVRCGDRHTVLLDGNNGVWVWGFNAYGQLGLGDTCPRNRPERVSITGPAQGLSARTNMDRGNDLTSSSSDAGGDIPTTSGHPDNARAYSIRAGGWLTCVLDASAGEVDGKGDDH